ncbi:autophagy-related protein 18g-like [Wolffia australiana]
MNSEKARNGLLPSSLKVISACLKTVSSNAVSVASTVRSAGPDVAAEAEKAQVLCANFEKLEFSYNCFRHALLLGYANGFQVLDVEDASNIREVVSKHSGPVTSLQMLPVPPMSEGFQAFPDAEGFRESHPLLLVVAGEECKETNIVHGTQPSPLPRETIDINRLVDCPFTPTAVRFFSLRSLSYVHVLRFRSAVYIVRCSPRIVAVALASQIFCFDALTLEKKFSVLTYPMHGPVGPNVGLGPLAVGPRWLAYSPSDPFLSVSGRLSPQNLTISPGVSPSTSPSGGTLVARYAVESSKQLAAGIINLGDMGYKKLSKYCQDLLPDGSSSPKSSSFGRKAARFGSGCQINEGDNVGTVVVKDFVSNEAISQFRAHSSPISALCFDPSGTLLVTASVNGNSLNIFRIMRNCRPTSHAHLYKLHRGITAAVIEDISFSHFSQWIAVVSSHGTCHIYVMSPFGGTAVIQTPAQQGNKALSPLTTPWWSTPTGTKGQLFAPPLPVGLSTVSRIKAGSPGWLSSMSSMTPSGAVAVKFKGFISSNAEALECILVCSPSGHLVQYELLPFETSDRSSKVNGPLNPAQDEELRVNAVPVMWWDVCRKLNWAERKCDSQEHSDILMHADDSRTNNDKSHWYFSNAEVRIPSGRIPIWQKSKVRFYSMDGRSAECSLSECTGGEIMIESIMVVEVETKSRDLLPVFARQRALLPSEKCTSEITSEHQESKCVDYPVPGKIQNTCDISTIRSASAPQASTLSTVMITAHNTALMADESERDIVSSLPEAYSGTLLHCIDRFGITECDNNYVERSDKVADNDNPSVGTVFFFSEEGENLNG